MSFSDLIRDTVSDIAERSAEPKVEIHVTAGKKCFQLSPFESRVIIRQNRDGFIYFDDINGLFKVSGYDWSGPVYRTVSTTVQNTASSGLTKTKGREKRTGRLVGAVVGTIVTGGNPAGALIGAMVGTGNKKSKGVSRSGGASRSVSTTQETQQEIPVTAYMTVTEPATGNAFTFGFDCDSVKNVEILNLLHRSLLEE